MLDEGTLPAPGSRNTSHSHPRTPGSSAPTLGESTAAEPVRKRMRLAEEGSTSTPYQENVSTDYSSAYVKETQGESHLNSTTEGTVTTKGDNKSLSAEDFQASLGKPEVTLQVRIPNDPSQIAWNFYGQILSMKVHVMTKIKDVKSELSRRHLNGMPPNKIQFRDTIIGFLKDSSTLASLNIGPTATVEMIPKTRGGRK